MPLKISAPRRLYTPTGGSSLRKKLTKLFVDKLWAGVWKWKLRDPRLRGRTSMEKTKKCGQQEKNRTWSRVPKQISVYRILWFNIQNVLHCLLIQRKTWEPAQKRSLWRNPDRKLCFLSFPIAQSNRSPDIQRLLQRFKFLNNIHLWLNQTEQEAHDHLCLVGQQTQSCHSNAFIKKRSIRRSTKIAAVNQ